MDALVRKGHECGPQEELLDSLPTIGDSGFMPVEADQRSRA